MKKVNLYCLLISVLCLIFIWGCGQGTKLENSNDSLEVEINLAKSLSVNKQDLKLIGFKTFYVSDENERIKIKELTPIIKEKASNYYIAEDGRFFRVYFPLHTAIVKCNDKIYYADEKGVVKTDDVINLDEVDVAVIGRKRSEYVRGTGTNIIEGDKLFLATPLLTNRNILNRGYVGTKSASYNLCVFDLGEQIVNSNECCDEVVKIKTRSEGGDGGKISCMANHGGKNCSNAFGINNGRCTFNPNVCMDYNGWFTDCVNGKVSNFPGSDCDTAMGRGECWNEIM